MGREDRNLKNKNNFYSTGLYSTPWYTLGSFLVGKVQVRSNLHSYISKIVQISFK